MPRTQPLQTGDPESLGDYRLLGRLGHGGQGVVYLGQAADGSRVAVKTLNSEGTNDPDQRQRFVREAEAARRVASFCTAAVLEVDFEATPAHIVSEFVDGPPLSEAVRQGGPLTGGDLNRVAVATATALMAIHEAGIVHRDFKPANVLLGQGGARVIDFGVARMTQGTATLTDSSIGTPAYMAPEQISGEPVSPVTDVYAWGAVVAYAATGRQPFTGDTVPAILHRVLNGEPDLGGVPEPLRTLLASAMRKEPSQRPTSTDILLRLVGREERPSGRAQATRVMSEAAASVGGPRPAGSGPGRNTEEKKRNGGAKWLIGAGIAVLVAGALAGGIILGRSMGGPTGESGSQTSPDPADGSAPGAPAGTVPAEDPRTELQPQAVPRFTEEYEEDWEGLSEDGDLYTIQIDEGERTVDLEQEDDDCLYTLTLTENTEDGYVAKYEDEDGSCMGSQNGEARVGLREGFLLVEMGDGESSEMFQLQPEE